MNAYFIVRFKNLKFPLQGGFLSLDYEFSLSFAESDIIWIFTTTTSTGRCHLNILKHEDAQIRLRRDVSTVHESWLCTCIYCVSNRMKVTMHIPWELIKSLENRLNTANQANDFISGHTKWYRTKVLLTEQTKEKSQIVSTVDRIEEV